MSGKGSLMCRVRIWTALLLVLMGTGIPAVAAPEQLVLECGPPTGGGDRIDAYGFYVPSLPADHLGRVEMSLISWTVGEFRITLEARSDTFDGALLGIATATVAFPNANPVPVSFDFFNSPLPRDTRVTFKFGLPDGGGPIIFFDVGPCAADPNCDACGGKIIETAGTEPPLGDFARNSVYAKIYAPPCEVRCVSGAPQHASLGGPASFVSYAWGLDCPGPMVLDWDFGDGSHSDQPLPEHAYAAAGVYHWTFTATQGGASCSGSGTIRVGSMLFASPAGTGSACSQASPCDLGTALTQALDGDTVALAGGRYTASGPQVAMVQKSLALAGKWDGAPSGDPAFDPGNPPSVLDGEDARRVILVTPGAFPSMESVTVTNGFDAEKGGGILAEGASLSLLESSVNLCHVTNSDVNTYGGGIFFSGGTLFLEATSFDGNTTGCNGCQDTQGGGLRVENALAARLVGCNFTYNYGWNGGAAYFENAPFSMEACIFDSNSAGYGAGIRMKGGSGSILHALFKGNSAGNEGGGILMDGSDLRLAGVAFQWNSSYVTAALGGSSSTLDMANCMVAGNRPGAAGTQAVDLYRCKAAFTHCTFAKNLGSHGGDGLRISDGSASLINNIIVGQLLGLEAVNGAQVTLDHTLWGAGDWANGTDVAGDGTVVRTADLFGDPLFSDFARGDYQISVGSPAQDAGVNAGLFEDWEQDPRPTGAGFDIGADEIFVRQPLAASVTATPISGNAPLDVAFTGAVLGGAPRYVYDWDFGDDSPHSSDPAPLHTYAAWGTYQTMLTVTDGLGATATSAPQTITVASPCSLDCSATAPETARARQAVDFHAEAAQVQCVQEPVFTWDFGDGQASTAQNPTHSYSSPASYHWSVTVSAEGNSCSRTGTITVTPGPPGDCNGDGTVSIGEVQKAINMFLGVEPPACGVDCNADGTVSIGEVQKVINGFLGLGTSC